jgi:hypothetical protein
MGNYKSAFGDNVPTPSLEAAEFLQENLDKDTISALLRVEKISVTGSGTSGVAATTIPVGAEIVDVVVHPTASVGSGTAKVRVGGAGADITNAMTMATLDTLARAATIDQTYKVVGADGIEVVTNGDSDQGDIYVYYKK